MWWIPTEPGHLPHQVADLPFAIDGMWSVHIDAGVLDAAIWADNQVVLLRGRPGERGGWTAGEREVAGVGRTMSMATG